MHTFFINASGQNIGNYSDILEIQHETKKLVSLECSMNNWYSETEGYKACVKKMGELIDTSKDVNNSFNLIIYIDLIAIEEYGKISMSQHLQRYACLEAMYPMLKRYINATIVEELKACGRTPNEVLVIFEENSKPGDKDDVTEKGRSEKHSFVKTLLGFPEDNVLREFVLEFEKNNVGWDSSALCNKLNETFKKTAVPELIMTYSDEIDTFVGELKESNSFTGSLEKFCERVIKGTVSDNDTVNTVSFITDRRADVANKREKARRDLRLSFYILNCVRTETVFEHSSIDDEEVITSVKEFPKVDWDKVAASILSKSKEYRSQYGIAATLSESFSNLDLAPVLYAFDNEKFALDEYGKKAHSIGIVDVKEDKSEEKNEKENKDGGDKNQKDIALGSVEKKEVVLNEVTAESLFSEEEYELFDYTGSGYEQKLNTGKNNAAAYIEEAGRLCEHHIEYLKKLKIHVTEVLSNYAGRSVENVPALLKKRNVTVTDHDFEDRQVTYNYAKKLVEEDEQPEILVKETKKLDTVMEISKNAYESAVLAYMEFCAGRSITVSNIKKQCDWFVTRVYQIEASIKKMKITALGFIAAFIFFYMPFVIIRWDAIVKSIVTGLGAIISLAVPLAIFCSVFVLAANLQKKKYEKEWQKFKAASDKALSENGKAAEKYDKLLSVFIPTLRWVYEYKLDVEFYADCCKMARAKVNHHKQKLSERINAIKNIIDDLELDDERLESIDRATKVTSVDIAIDYNASFCTGDTNRNFYSFGTGESVF